MTHKRTFQDLVELMARLRAPDGCPWDREQTYQTLGPMLIEEAYEVIEAVESQDWNDLCDELGDLMFQIIFYGQIAAEKGHFDVQESLTRVHEKMTRRHPHVFGEVKVEGAADVLVNWEAIKASERKRGAREEKEHQSRLDVTSTKLPALLEPYQLTTKAARVGFDWEKSDDVFLKLEEEIREFREELKREDRDQAAVGGEIGDLLFVMANVAGWYGVGTEIVLNGVNRKLRRSVPNV